MPVQQSVDHHRLRLWRLQIHNVGLANNRLDVHLMTRVYRAACPSHPDTIHRNLVGLLIHKEQ